MNLKKHFIRSLNSTRGKLVPSRLACVAPKEEIVSVVLTKRCEGSYKPPPKI